MTRPEDRTDAADDGCSDCGHPSDRQPGHRLDCPTIKRVPPRMRFLSENASPGPDA